MLGLGTSIPKRESLLGGVRDKSDGYVLGVPVWARLRGLDWIGAAVAVERVIYV